jgi:hypothetical protein
MRYAKQRINPSPSQNPIAPIPSQTDRPQNPKIPIAPKIPKSIVKKSPIGFRSTGEPGEQRFAPTVLTIQNPIEIISTHQSTPA